jgi:hypothetical protein
MKIGFIDYHLNNYHANKFHGLLTGTGHTIAAAYEFEPTGEDWCAGKGVTRVGSPQEVINQSEALIVLAPDDSERHLRMAREALQSGKPVFVDKYLSTSLADAREMVQLAEKSNTPLMSSSSLRFSVELEDMLAAAGGKKLDGIFSRGFGKWSGYACHSVAPALRMLGAPARRLIDTGSGTNRLVTIEAADGRRMLVELRKSENQMEATPWQIGHLDGDQYRVATISKFDEFYANLMKEAVAFFQSGKSPVSAEEMLDTVAIEVGADQSLAKGGEWVTV